MRRAIAIVFLAVACSREPEASKGPKPSVECTSDWRTMAPGAQYRMLNCSPGTGRFDLHLIRIDPKVFRLDALVRDAATAEDLGKKWAFAINANFFDEKYRPLGVVVSGGRQINGDHNVSWQSVFLVTGDGKPHIVRAPEWDAWRERAQVAAQAGPRLIVDGKRNEVVQAQADWRSGVCVAGDHAIFFVTPQESRFDVWQMIDHAAGLGCRDAMLFDGGPSTQFLLRGAASLEGDQRVPAFVVGGR